MKLYVILTIFLTFCAALSPFAVLSPRRNESKPEKKTVITEKNSESGEEETLNVLKTETDKITQKDMTEYIIGTVAAEISPEYETEAIKAQAVVCYTNVLRQKMKSENEKNFGLDTNPRYPEKDELQKKWGKRYDEYLKKITDCVNAVNGKYLEYDGEPILAYFHAISTGRTESAKNVLGIEIPYLQSVVANGDLLSPDIDSEVTFSDEDFIECAKKLGGIKLLKNSSEWLGKVKTTKAGTVISIVIGSKEFSGNDVRKAFSLKSPAFTVEKTKDGFKFSVKGCGNLVGMSQYSADYMARQGANYEEILMHFYKGAKLK
ncbi:MAG: stage II sporulation protein D [Clostridia bacterium]|nr:stage II sporulation protein D [Clostridia bacterium]